jgi:hypothetical protein
MGVCVDVGTKVCVMVGVFVGVEVAVGVPVGVPVCVAVGEGLGEPSGVHADPGRKQFAAGVVSRLKSKPSFAAAKRIPGSKPAKRRMPHAP